MECRKKLLDCFVYIDDVYDLTLDRLLDTDFMEITAFGNGPFHELLFEVDGKFLFFYRDYYFDYGSSGGEADSLEVMKDERRDKFDSDEEAMRDVVRQLIDEMPMFDSIPAFHKWHSDNKSKFVLGGYLSE